MFEPGIDAMRELINCKMKFLFVLVAFKHVCIIIYQHNFNRCGIGTNSSGCIYSTYLLFPCIKLKHRINNDNFNHLDSKAAVDGIRWNSACADVTTWWDFEHLPSTSLISYSHFLLSNFKFKSRVQHSIQKKGNNW